MRFKQSKSKNGISGFVVRVETVKDGIPGVQNWIRYLEDTEHENHKEKTEILEIHNNTNYLINAIKGVDDLNYKRKKELGRKAGRGLSCYGYSYLFTVPSGENYQYSLEKWKKLSSKLVDEIAIMTGIERKILLKGLKINLHNQSNQHLNFLISPVMAGQKFDFTKDKFLNQLKSKYNNLCLEIFGLDSRTYQPESKIPKSSSIEKLTAGIKKPQEYKIKNQFLYKMMTEQFKKRTDELLEADKKTKEYVQKMAFHIKHILLGDEDTQKHISQFQKKKAKLPSAIQKQISQNVKEDYGLNL